MKLALAFLAIAAAFAQQFEVATVKIAQPGSNMSTIVGLRDGQFTARNSPLIDLLRYAYGTSQISGPDWLAAARYDIVAAAPPDAKPADAPAMLRALLEERFQMKVHREEAERDVYVLEAPNGAAKLAAIDPNKKPDFPTGNNAFLLLNGNMRQWADLLGRIVDRPVIDRTGIEGTQRHMFAYGQGDDSTLPGIFTALPEQTGLRLTATKAEVEIVIIDSAERVPAEN